MHVACCSAAALARIVCCSDAALTRACGMCMQGVTVFAYLWVVGTGLLGYLLFTQFLQRGNWWVWILEIIPSFALYRGLYEFSEYAFRAGYQVRRRGAADRQTHAA
jgi:hypothetical protein